MKRNSIWAFFLPLPVPPGRPCSTTQQRRPFFGQHANPAHPPPRHAACTTSRPDASMHNSRLHNFMEPFKKATVSFDVKARTTTPCSGFGAEAGVIDLTQGRHTGTCASSLFLHIAARRLCPPHKEPVLRPAVALFREH